MVAVAGSATAQVIPLLSPERAALIQRRRTSAVGELWDVLDAVKDPEIPALSLWDLGVLQDIQATDAGITVIITPTYSGCPAIDTMATDIQLCLHQHGVDNIVVQQRLSPAWSTDWLEQAGRQALQNFGIAPPSACQQTDTDQAQASVSCPRCASQDTRLVSEFGSTSCKSLYQCQACLEPFDYFKPL